MQLKFQVFGQLFLITENYPAETSINKTVFMSGTMSVHSKRVLRIDTLHSGNFETEFHTRSSERTEHRAAGAIDVNRDIQTWFLLVFVEELGDLSNWFVVTSIC